VSGLTLVDPGFGSFVVVNHDHPSLRRRFSYAHEYCHVLMDRARRGAISSQDNRGDLLEVRANSFAANFLLPTEGVRNFLNGLGKGHPSRSQAEVFDEEDTVRVRDRSAPGSQDIQMYDLVQLAHHFKVSRLSTIYRLRNLKLISETEMNEFLESEEDEAGLRIEKILNLPDPEVRSDRNQFRHRFLGLGLEALRRGEITKSKLVELGAMVEVSAEDLDRFLAETGLQDEQEADTLLPSG
jgi:Zn-dependent peptidase ImmA (M78 family)